jgi:hypothetical protein
MVYFARSAFDNAQSFHMAYLCHYLIGDAMKLERLAQNMFFWSKLCHFGLLHYFAPAAPE